MTRRRSSFSPETETRALEAVGEKIAAHFNVPLTDVRYATYRVYDGAGARWTIICGWERLIDGEWHAEDWLPPVHSC